MIAVRFHGRGGQGAKIASRILGRSGFQSGLHAQDFALFGAERRGAPVVSFTRLASEPIEQRGNIEQPSLVVVIDDTLLHEARGQIFQGVQEKTPLFVNADPARTEPMVKSLPAANYRFIDLSAIARQTAGAGYVSAPAAAVAAKCIASIDRRALADAVQAELADCGLAPDLIEKNLAAAMETYERTPLVEPLKAAPADEAASPSRQAVPYLGKSAFIGPTIRRRGSAVLRTTGNWRVERPEIDLSRCKRCFLCYLYCPEAAIRLDSENFPQVDYEHCKGCLICYEECPTDAIARRLEE